MMNGQKFSDDGCKKAVVEFVKKFVINNKNKNNEADRVLLNSLYDYFKKSLKTEKGTDFIINSDGI